MVMGGRRMGGFIRLDEGGFDQDSSRRQLTEIALAFTASLPPK